ncbi:MAG: DNA repair protein RecO [bacterium]|nr:DNA repair protein RecO [bacterium]
MGVVTRPTAATEALVLRVWPCGETSAVASLLTRDHGYVKVIAKAARRPLSTLRALVEPGRLVTVEFSLDPARELQYLRGGGVDLDALGGEPTLERSAYLLGALELVDRCRPTAALARVDDSAAELFAVCDAFLRMLSSPAGPDPALAFFAFEWELLDRHGLAPDLGHCCACGMAVAEVAAAARRFSAAEGGLMCGACARGGADEGCRPLGDEALALLAALAAGGLSAAWTMAAPAAAVRREVGAHLHRFLGYHLPGYRLPGALDLLRAGRAAVAGDSSPA